MPQTTGCGGAPEATELERSDLGHLLHDTLVEARAMELKGKQKIMLPLTRSQLEALFAIVERPALLP